MSLSMTNIHQNAFHMTTILNLCKGGQASIDICARQRSEPNYSLDPTPEYLIGIQSFIETVMRYPAAIHVCMKLVNNTLPAYVHLETHSSAMPWLMTTQDVLKKRMPCVYGAFVRDEHNVMHACAQQGYVCTSKREKIYYTMMLVPLHDLRNVLVHP